MCGHETDGAGVPEIAYTLVDEANEVYWGPFATYLAAEHYAQDHGWGPSAGTGGRFGQGWSVRELISPTWRSDSVSLDRIVHATHVAQGENHWQTCGLCDDESPEG